MANHIDGAPKLERPLFTCTTRPTQILMFQRVYRVPCQIGPSAPLEGALPIVRSAHDRFRRIARVSSAGQYRSLSVSRDDARCPTVRDGILLYRDSSHVTNTAMEALIPVFQRQLEAAGLVPGRF